MLQIKVGPKVLSVLALVSLCAACAQHSSSAMAAAPAPAATPAPAITGAPLVRGLPDFTALVAAAGPAVVNVQVIERANPNARANGNNPFGNDDNDDALGDFFRRFGIPRNAIPDGRGNNTPSRGEGSGFIVTSDGYVLTNHHVVDNASKVTVKLTDQREYIAKVVGSDETSDIAVLKIEGKNLPVVRIGDPSKLRVGEWVVAIGSPFGMENSVTAGIVSAKGRSMNNGNKRNYVNFIQTDVAVNPGNSGGPLFNMSGEVVGINSQILSGTGNYAGLSFAIPIDIANNVREQLVKSGRVSRGIIGVTIQQVTAALAESYGLDRPRGAVVGTVSKGGPADRAGILADDVILSVNGKQVDTNSDLPPMIAEIRPGTNVQLEVWRNKAIKRVNLVVDELPEDKKVASTARSLSKSGAAASTVEKLGLSVRELTATEKRQLRTDGSVVVEEATGPAAEAGIRNGDIILAVSGKEVANVDDLRSAVRGAAVARLRVQSGENGDIGIIAVRPE
jgi:serine protease Do